MTDVRSKVFAAFQVEHKELVEGIRAFLASFPEEGGAHAGVDEAFRLAHSLKGGARVCDLRDIEQVGHHMESVLSKIREGVVQLDRAVRDALVAALDAIEDSMAKSPAAGPKDASPAMQDVIARLSVVGAEGTPTAVSSIISTTGGDAPAPANAVGAREESAPEIAPEPDSLMLRVRGGSLDRIFSLSGDLLAEIGRQVQLGAELEFLDASVREAARECETISRWAGPILSRFANNSVSGKMTSHLELMDRRTRQVAQQVRRMRTFHRRSLTTSHGVCEELQRQVCEARMVSAENVFQGFRRMVRLLAQEDGKEVEFRSTGLDVTADRNVLERLRDPVMHILRNAVAHGIERPKERTEQGKAQEGQITLKARIVGNRLVIVVEDDGRGIDYPQVAQAAHKRGWIESSDVASAPSEQLDRFLFRPGFTTKADVDHLAGRGMGLSVVRETVVRLQGEVRLLPRAGTGSAIEINVPLTVSTHRLLMATCGEMTVGIPLFAVERVLKVRMEDMVTVANRACLVVDGRTLPVCRLQQLLNPQDAPEAMERNSLFVVVLKAGVARSAVVVDQLVGERNSVIRDIRGPAGSDARFSGSILLDDGRLALVVHPPALLDSAPGAAPLPAAKESESLSVSRDPLILIVDDSFTTRTLEKNILETRGYAVRVAVDGADALKQLRSESIDLVVSDIQMPHVDGFQMLEAMRADVRLAEIPVILVTSMDRCEYRERGLALGAHAYIVKQRFDHEELLATIGRFVEPNHGPIAARVGASIT